jgi:hypothetical protein
MFIPFYLFNLDNIMNRASNKSIIGKNKDSGFFKLYFEEKASLKGKAM